jgi:hypothetical protein
MVHYTSLASEEKEIRCEVQLGNLENDQMNWRLRGVQVGPMILLKSLLAQNRHSLHDFLNGVGVQDRRPILTVNVNWCLK